jgi:hypothetical protein
MTRNILLLCYPSPVASIRNREDLRRQPEIFKEEANECCCCSPDLGLSEPRARPMLNRSHHARSRPRSTGPSSSSSPSTTSPSTALSKAADYFSHQPGLTHGQHSTRQSGLLLTNIFASRARMQLAPVSMNGERWVSSSVDLQHGSR